jgi:tryptophan-rich sensory protein
VSGAKKGRWVSIVAAAAAAVAVAGLGAMMTDLGPWYLSLRQPAWKPPDWLFGPGWTLIFGFAALAGVTAWRQAPSGGARTWLLVLFALNAVLNILWSMLFFRVQRPDWALMEVVFLWLSIVWLILSVSRYSKPAAWLLMPYLAWVTFAATLNFAVVRLNAPF